MYQYNRDFQDADHWQSREKGLSAKLAHVLNNQLFTDVTIKLTSVTSGPVDAVVATVKCHRLILAMNSPAFEAMLSRRWSSSRQKYVCRKDDELQTIEISIPADPNAFQLVLDFLYTGTLPSTLELSTILELHKFSCLYIIQDLNDECTKRLCSAMTNNINNLTTTETDTDDMKKLRQETYESILPIYEQAYQLSESRLQKLALGCIKRNATEILQTESILYVANTTLCTIFDMEDLKISSELELFNAAVRWAEKECIAKKLEINSTNLRSVLGEVVPLIRFPLLSPDIVATEIVPKGILTLEERIELLTYFTLTQEKRQKLSKLLYFCTQPRKYNSLQYTLRRFEEIGSADFDFSRNWRFLCFTVDRPINIVSLGFYGSSSSENVEFEVRVSISHRLEESTELPVVNRRIIDDCTKTYQVEGSTKLFYFTFDKPVAIVENIEYSIGYIIKGSNTLMGDEIQDTMIANCGENGLVTFQFGLAKIKNNRYQIPEICFTV